MRDLLAFELYLRQAKRSSARMRLRDHPHAEQEFAKLETPGALEPAPVWFRPPLCFRGIGCLHNRFG